MKLVELKIAPKHSWEDVSDTNPLRATVKIKSKDSAIETVLPERAHMQIIDLCREIVADAARENINAFCAELLPHIGSIQTVEADND